jgi:spore coat polysaccharide biosynthesis protein SpsF
MKTAITITARMKSTRLPKKAMKDLLGKPMIERIIERVKYAKKADEIILCTSTNPQDDILATEAKRTRIKCFRGSENDVLKRLLDAAKEYKIDFIASTSGDNPLADPHYIDRLIEKFKETDADYITCLDLPLGTFSYGVKVSALEKVVSLKTEKETEIWGVYFKKSNLFKKEELSVEDRLRHPEMRLTVDTPEDFRLMEEIYKRLNHEGELFELSEVVDLLEKSPELRSINACIIQKTAPEIDMRRLVK